MQTEDCGQRRGGADRRQDHALGVNDAGRSQACLGVFIEKTDQRIQAAGLETEVFIPEGEIAGCGQPAGVVAGLGRVITPVVFQNDDLRKGPFQPGKGGMLGLSGHHDDLQGHLVGLG